MEKIIRRSSAQSQPDPNSGAGDLIGSNEDLLREILIHIPRKPLARFKSVSKLWLSVISDPDFSLRWNTKHSALLIYRCNNYKFIPLGGQIINPFGPNFDFNFDSLCLFSDHSCHRIQILQSCNGLLLVNLKLKLINLKSYDVRIGVYNTRTNQSKLIPKFPKEYSNLTNYTNLAFDPLKSPHYKLVSVLLGEFPRREILIYSSETDSWKVLSKSRDYIYDLMLKAGVFLNGAIHWPSKRGSSLYFDVDKECCARMPMPPIQGSEGERTIRYFGESGGHLCLIDYKDDFALKFDVFEMEKDYSKWFVKYNVDLTTLGRPITRFTILSLIVKKGDDVEKESPVLVMYVPLDKMVVSYNLKNGESEKLCQLLLNRWEMDKLKTNKCSMVHHITC